MDEEEFVDTVRTWVKMDDIIRDKMLEVRELKEQRKQMEQSILDFMKTSDQDVLNISSGGTLRRSTSRTKQGLKEEYLRQMLSKFGSTPEEAASMVHTILSERPCKEREYLKRCQPRKNKLGGPSIG